MSITKSMMEKATNLKSMSVVCDWDRGDYSDAEKITVWFDKWSDDNKPTKKATIYTAYKVDADNVPNCKAAKVVTYTPFGSERICWFEADLTEGEQDQLAHAEGQNKSITLIEQAEKFAKAMRSSLLKSLTIEERKSLQTELAGHVHPALTELTSGKTKAKGQKLTRDQIRKARFEQMFG